MIRVGKINKRELGGEKELVAAEYLAERGYQILEHNFFCRSGEIDLIAKEGGYLVFIEVKYRKDGAFGSPEEAVTKRKQRVITKVARYYLLKNGYSQNTLCRFDVVAIAGQNIDLITNAFEG